jgi:hypothetical protein
MFAVPQVVTFYLIEAKKARDRAERRRKAALRARRESDDGMSTLTDQAAVLDALAGLTTAVLLSFAAIEALANACIEKLEEDVTLPVERNGVTVNIGKADMIRSLRISEKLDRAVPLFTAEPSIKGTQPWENYVHLRRMRDNLVHVKELGYSNDPDEPSVFGGLLRGSASGCVEDAVAVVEALQPTWLNDAARGALAR